MMAVISTYECVDIEELLSYICNLHGGWAYLPPPAIGNTLAAESSCDDLMTETEA